MSGIEEYSLLLLAGGKSTRMGSNKAELLLEGKNFLKHMLQKGRELGLCRFYVSGYVSGDEDVCTVFDCFPDRGPLGGIHACMKVMNTPYCLVLPVDAPLLPLEILKVLLEQHKHSVDREKVLIWEHGDRKEPLIAIYPASMADTIEGLIKDQSVAVFRALDLWGYDCFRLETEEELIINVNTPELYQKIISL